MSSTTTSPKATSRYRPGQIRGSYDVPKSTLCDRITGRVSFAAKAGPTPYLTHSEENELASFLVYAAKIGYPFTRKRVLYLVQQIVEDKGVRLAQGQVTNGWWESFKKRHPKIILRSAAPLSHTRALASDQEVIDRYFNILEETLKDNKIFDKPNCIFNCDETGMPLCPKSLKIITSKGDKNPTYATGQSKSQITILACSNAAGYSIPPFVIFSRATYNKELCRGEVPGTLYGTSETGWMNRSLFEKWFVHHFLVYAPKIRPLILLMDGHSSHYCPEFIKRAAAEKIILFTLPPNTTHITQPLDKGCFSPLKVYWRQACHDFYSHNPGRVVTVYEFSELFSKAWLSAMSAKNIVASFECTGIYPFNRYAITVDDGNECLSKPGSLAEQTGLARIPFYSPSRKCPEAPMKPLHATPDNSTDSEEYTSESDENAWILEPTSSSLSKYLVTPKLEHPVKRIKSCGRVLTSIEISEEVDGRESVKAKRRSIPKQKS